MTNYWLMKSEPETYSIDQLKKDKFTKWEGVRNFQARNFMRDGMKVGDLALFYHSNAKPSGVAGICRISKTMLPDLTAQNPKSEYFDPKASPENPIWIMVEVEYVSHFTHLVPIQTLRETKGLEDLKILQKGSRLSITPLTKREFEIIKRLGNS